MPLDSWEDVVKALRDDIAEADEGQHELAQSIGIELPAGIPALVAAALLREALAEPLRVDSSTPPSYEQLEYLQDLLDATGEDKPKYADTKEQMSAWLDVLDTIRTIKALEELQPRPGDIVSHIYRREEVWKVASISRSGRVNFAGHGRRSIAPHLVTMEVRVSDGGQEAKKARTRAANQSASRERQTYPTARKLAPLQQYKVSTPATWTQVELLREAIESAQDERPVQRCLESHPALLVALVSSSLGRYVRPQVSLGGNKIPDFAIAAADSMGVHWTLVELESPTEAVAKKDGTFADRARSAIQQIEDWREWLQANLDYARRPPDEQGLGLPDIRPESPGLVFIGRRDDVPAARAEVRRRLIEQRQITLHSYDWLLLAVEAGIERQNRPGAPLDWPDWTEE